MGGHGAFWKMEARQQGRVHNIHAHLHVARERTEETLGALHGFVLVDSSSPRRCKRLALLWWGTRQLFSRNLEIPPCCGIKLGLGLGNRLVWGLACAGKLDQTLIVVDRRRALRRQPLGESPASSLS